jgi:RimJ/RimL family protein N-acetyltransferase
MLLFETERLVVRRFASADSDHFFRVNGNAVVMQYIRPAKNRKESDVFLQENINFYQDTSVLGRYAVFEKAGNFIGMFSILYMSGDADFHIGYALLPEAWGKGYATELVHEGLSFFFNNTVSPSVFAITVSENKASQRVLIKAGFSLEGSTEENGKKIELFSFRRESKLKVNS